MLSGVQWFLTLSKQQPTLISHNPVTPLVINLAAVDLQRSPDPSVVTSGSDFDNAGNCILKLYVVSLGG
jgi:hypothetical protein